MSNQTELIYIGNCKNIIDDLNISLYTKKIVINREDIKVKKGTKELISPVQEWGYYPVSFDCKDDIESPSGNFIAGDFMHHSFGCYGYMSRIER
jgi:hypothetical protein